MIKRTVLIDYLELDVFDQGSVTLVVLASRLIAKKSSIWVAKVIEIKPINTRELVLML